MDSPVSGAGQGERWRQTIGRGRAAPMPALPPIRPAATAGGLPIALGAIGGAATGFVLHEPTLCFLIGLALGIVVALLIWWRGK